MLLIVVRARARAYSSRMAEFIGLVAEEARSRGRQYFSRDYRAEGKLLGKWSMNERLPRVIRKIFPLGELWMLKRVRKETEELRGGRIFYFKIVYANFVRLIVEIIFQRWGWLKRIGKRRNCGVSKRFMQVCKLFNCWNWPKKGGIEMEKEEIMWKEEFYFYFKIGSTKFTLGLKCSWKSKDRNGKWRNCMEEEFFLFLRDR